MLCDFGGSGIEVLGSTFWMGFSFWMGFTVWTEGGGLVVVWVIVVLTLRGFCGWVAIMFLERALWAGISDGEGGWGWVWADWMGVEIPSSDSSWWMASEVFVPELMMIYGWKCESGGLRCDRRWNWRFRLLREWLGRDHGGLRLRLGSDGFGRVWGRDFRAFGILYKFMLEFSSRI
jgi:hypothetical protein